MKNLQKSRILVFTLGLVFICAAFLQGFLSLNTYQRLESNVSETLPQGVHIPININTADVTTLCLLDDIGEKTAMNIIAYREENGDFESVEDIMLVKGIGEKTFEKIKNYIYTE